MAFSSAITDHLHRAGHVMGDLPKKTSIGHGKRKQGSYKKGTAKKRYRGQGRR